MHKTSAVASCVTPLAAMKQSSSFSASSGAAPAFELLQPNSVALCPLTHTASVQRLPFYPYACRLWPRTASRDSLWQYSRLRINTPARYARWLPQASSLCTLFANPSAVAITDFISPYRADRLLAHELHNAGHLPFVKVFVDVPPQVVD